MDFYKWHIYYVCLVIFFLVRLIAITCFVVVMQYFKYHKKLFDAVHLSLQIRKPFIKIFLSLSVPVCVLFSLSLYLPMGHLQTHSNVKLNCIVFEIFLCWAQFCVALAICCNYSKIAMQYQKWKIPPFDDEKKMSKYEKEWKFIYIKALWMK